MSEKNKHELSGRSSEIIEDIRQLKQLETAKRAERISTPRFHDLATRVTNLSREIMRDAKAEEDLGNATTRGEESIDDIERADEERAG